MRRIAILNQKGGVGKTTTAVNLGAALARAGRRVVLVDLDPQGNLSTHVGHEIERGAASSYGVLTGDCDFEAALRSTTTPGLRLVPTDIDLSGAELELATEDRRERRMADAIDRWVEASFQRDGAHPAEYVLFDCPPSLGLLSLNALCAAEEVFVALQTEFLALQGMTRLLEVVELVRENLNPTLSMTGIVPCIYDNRLRLAREVLGEIRQYFPRECFRKAISSNVKLAEAPSYGQHIFEYAPDSTGARDYRELAEEVVAQERTRAADRVSERTVEIEPVPPPSAAETDLATRDARR
ncbi:MAG: ParA family protein [Planctomycetota bacterium]|jgi:chromosome partitioning protein